MKVENLEVGFVAKNYKFLCKILCEKERGGESKKAQFKNWERYFEYRKDGQKIIITKIYDRPKPVQARPGNNTIPYIPQIKELLIQILLRSKNKKVLMAKDKLLESLKMINNNYHTGRKYIDNLSKYTNIKKIEIYDFYNTTGDMLKRHVEKALNELTNNRAIFWTKVYMVSKYNQIDIATDEEYDLILQVHTEVLKSMGYEGVSEVIVAGRKDEFSKKCNKIFKTEHEINFVYEAYSINLNRNRLEEVFVKIKNENVLEIGIELNRNVQDRIHRFTIKRQDKVIKNSDEWFGVCADNKKGFRTDKDFILNQSKLSDILIDISHKPISDQLKEK